MDSSTARRIVRRDLTDTFIRVGLVVVLTVACLRVVEPFVPLLRWALVLAIAL